MTREGHGAPLERLPLREAAHPVPDARCEAAAREVLDLVSAAHPDDVLLVLLSGGASALLSCPLGSLTRDDLALTTRELLACGAAGLESIPRDGGPEPEVASALELLGVALEHERFQAAATAVATELATRLDCERVALGFARNGQTRVEALSHSARFDDRAVLIRDIAAAMDEACDQDATIAVPAAEGGPAPLARARRRPRSLAGKASGSASARMATYCAVHSPIPGSARSASRVSSGEPAPSSVSSPFATARASARIAATRAPGMPMRARRASARTSGVGKSRTTEPCAAAFASGSP